MSKENLLELDNFRDEFGQSFRGLLNAVAKKHSNTIFGDYSDDFEYRRIINFINSFNQKAIDQTREETIREVEENYPTPHFLNGLAKASYSEIEFMAFKNGVFQTYQRLKQSLKSLINK